MDGHGIFHVSDEVHIGFVQGARRFFQIIEDNRRRCDLWGSIAKETLCIYGDFDVEGDELVHPPAATRFCGSHKLAMMESVDWYGSGGPTLYNLLTYLRHGRAGGGAWAGAILGAAPYLAPRAGSPSQRRSPGARPRRAVRSLMNSKFTHEGKSDFEPKRAASYRR